MIRWRPAGKVRLVIGFSPSSASDFMAETIAPHLSTALGQSVEIQRHLGEDGAVAAKIVASSAPDGSVVFMATLGTHAVAPYLAGLQQYDPIADFVPLSLIARAPLILAVHPSLQASNLHELIALARSMPGQLTYGTSAIGGAPHLAGELFQAIADVSLKHQRYEQTKQLFEDLTAGRIVMSFNNVMSMTGCIKNKKLRGLAVTGAERCALLPDLPTMAEAGLPRYELTNWLGLVAPANTPEAVANAYQDGVREAIRDPGVKAIFKQHGIEPIGSSPSAFADLLHSEKARLHPIVFKITNA